MQLKKIFCLFSIVLFFTACKSTDKKELTKILWVGSSSTYNHEMPLQVANWLNEYSDFDTVASFMVGRSGTGFHDYLKDSFKAQYGLKPDQDILSKLRDEGNDFVIVQQIAYFIAEKDSLEIIDATKKMCEAIRNAGGEPVFYEMGWTNDSLNKVGRKMIRQEARKNNIEHYAPCSEAWARVRDERPDIELFNLPDTDHPGTYGAYLNFCCLYLSITGELPTPLPNTIGTWPGFGTYDKQVAREKLESVNMPYFFEDMPGFIKMLSVMQTERVIPDEVASYLANVAEKTWKETMNKIL